MRNLNFLRTVVFLLLTCALYPALSQKVILEKNPSSENTPINYQSNFDKQSYNLLSSEFGQKIYTLNDTPQVNAEENQHNTNDVTVTIETADGIPPAFIMVYDDMGYMNMPMMGNTLNVPPGIYDILLYFVNIDGKDRIIIKELIDIQEDTTILADINEANHYVSAKLYNENGELLEPGLYDPDTGDVNGGNSTIFLDRLIYFAPTGHGLAVSNIPWDMKFVEGEDPSWSFYINEISNRYSILQNAIGLGYEGKLYFNKFEILTSISEPNIVLENNPNDYVFHQQEFTSSPLGISGGVKLLAFTTMDIINNEPVFGLTMYNSNNVINSGEKFEAYLNNPLEEGPFNFLVFPAIIDYVATDGPFTGQGFYTIGNAIVKEDDQIFYGSHSASTNGYFLGDITYFDATLKALPFHPKFSFSYNEGVNVNIGNNTPNSVTAFYENSLKSNYIGRYGERRDSDFFGTNVEVKQNNNIVFSGNYINDGFLNYMFPTTGNFQVTFSNTNSNIEGIEGKNITQLQFNKDLDDSIPPTLQHLQFRNVNGIVTDHFTSTQDGILRLAAGDFNFNIDNLGYLYYAYNEGNTVEFYYSSYNQENWTELELTEYPEYFQMPAFGDYYETSLTNVVVPEDNSWFDVKIICTDAAGNKQEQIISPAFKIEQATMGVEEVNQSGFTVYPNPFTNELNVQLPENLKGNYIFKVSDLSGKTIYAQSQNDKSFVWNGSSLPKGVYVLSIENNGKTITKKVVKK